MLPDLVVHQGLDLVNEHKNPDLIPGMYPTLFLFGIGGFEDKSRPVSISFQQQAQYYLNIVDCSFHYHHSFMFVVLNMTQHCIAYLQTSFTVYCLHFHHVAQNITQISPAILDSLATKLKHEHKFSDLAPAKKMHSIF